MCTVVWQKYMNYLPRDTNRHIQILKQKKTAEELKRKGFIHIHEGFGLKHYGGMYI